MRSVCLAAFAVLISYNLSGQQLQLINSGDVLERSSVLGDSGKFDLAIQELLSVPKRDTNYVQARLDLAAAYISKDQDAEALKVLQALNTKGTSHQARYITILGSALDGTKQYDKAIEVLKSGLERFPFSATMRYQLAGAYHNKGDYARAVDAYFDVLEISPYYSSAHLNLSRISMWQGRKTHAMMSMGMFLAINPGDNRHLRLLNDFVSNQLTDEGSEGPTGSNAFERLDKIIKSRIAMDDKFKTQVPINEATVKQFEMMFKQLSTVSSSVDDPWVKFYLPLYKSLDENGAMPAFLYHIMTSAQLPEVKKWSDKNKTALDKMFGVANTVMRDSRGTIEVPMSMGLGKAMPANYANNNLLSALGAMVDGKKSGPWVYFFPNSQKASEGKYDKDERIGTWRYYRDNGTLGSIEEYGQNSVHYTEFYVNGNKLVEYSFSNGKIDGKLELFHSCGALKEVRQYKDGIKTGKGTQYFPGGTVKAEFEYLDDKLTGTWIAYRSNGKVEISAGYKQGKREGMMEMFWPNGRLREKGEYRNDLLEGPWIGFHPNGQLDYRGSLKNGKRTGEWQTFLPNGLNNETIHYNDEGELDGETILYFKGKVYNRNTFKKDRLVNVVCLNEDGKQLFSQGNEEGNLNVKFYYATGQLQSEGAFKNGKREGKWSIWYIGGVKKEDNYYVDGKVEGEQISYHENGKRKTVIACKEGKANGVYLEYYATGKLKGEGISVNDSPQQQWRSYHENGQVENDVYNMNGKPFDTTYVYTEGGKLWRKSYDDENGIQFTETYGSMIPVMLHLDSRNKEVNEKVMAGGVVNATYRTQCGVMDGKYTVFYGDGSKAFETSSSAGAQHGTHMVFHTNGNVAVSGAYVMDKQEGDWRYSNPNGKTAQVIHFIQGRRDSVRIINFDTGNLMTTQEFENDNKSGIARHYAPDGGVLVEKLYEQDQLARYRTKGANGQFGPWTNFTPSASIIAYYPGGKKAFEEHYENGVENGWRRVYYSSGKVCTEINNESGMYQGVFTTYYPSGQVCSKIPFVNDDKNGLEEWFDEKGLPIVKIEYKSSQRDGITTTYANGIKVKETTFYQSFPEN